MCLLTNVKHGFADFVNNWTNPDILKDTNNNNEVLKLFKVNSEGRPNKGGRGFLTRLLQHWTGSTWTQSL